MLSPTCIVDPAELFGLGATEGKREGMTERGTGEGGEQIHVDGERSKDVITQMRRHGPGH